MTEKMKMKQIHQETRGQTMKTEDNMKAKKENKMNEREGGGE